MKSKIIDKARLAYGLTIVLRDDIDSLRTYAGEGDLRNLQATIQDTNDTLYKIIWVLAGMEKSVDILLNNED